MFSRLLKAAQRQPKSLPLHCWGDTSLANSDRDGRETGVIESNLNFGPIVAALPQCVLTE